MSGFPDQDTGVMELYGVIQVYAVLSHGRFLQMIKLNVATVLLVAVPVESPVCPM